MDQIHPSTHEFAECGLVAPLRVTGQQLLLGPIVHHPQVPTEAKSGQIDCKHGHGLFSSRTSDGRFSRESSTMAQETT
jgi:hypothetical protein